MPSDRTENTKVWCPVCKMGTVHVELTHDLVVSPRDAIYGPGSRGQHQWRVTSIHCGSTECGVLFHAIPGKPDEVDAILRRVMRQERCRGRRNDPAENLVMKVKQLLQGGKLPEVKRFIDKNKKNEKNKKKKADD